MQSFDTVAKVHLLPLALCHCIIPKDESQPYIHCGLHFRLLQQIIHLHMHTVPNSYTEILNILKFSKDTQGNGRFTTVSQGFILQRTGTFYKMRTIDCSVHRYNMLMLNRLWIAVLNERSNKCTERKGIHTMVSHIKTDPSERPLLEFPFGDLYTQV